ncbi:MULTISPECIES: hypothetical protein [unclassified Neisseria]|uniref:hypothetical protein n=1 Tax=unclassified Neisseria TaxID=2623750 RepID=UPI000A6F0A58|nr:MULTISPECIES: hypothetical protein [unclassified Neisseria]
MKKIILLTLISFTFTACSSTSKTPLSPEEKAEAEYKKNYTEVASHTIKTRSGNLTVIDRIHNRYSDDTTTSSMNLMIIRKSNTVKARSEIQYGKSKGCTNSRIYSNFCIIHSCR